MRTESRRKVVPILAALFGLVLPVRATVLLDQTSWTTTTRRTQSLPTRSAWFASSTGSLSVSGGALRMVVGTSSGAGISYFTANSNTPPVQLNVGDTLAATFRFTFNGVPPLGSSSQGFKIGLFDSADGSNVPKRVTADGSPFSSGGQGTFVEGYALFQKMYVVFADNQPIDIRKRTAIGDASLLGASADYTSLAKGGLTNTFAGFSNLTQYTFQILLQRTNLSSMAIAMTWSNLANAATLSLSTADNTATNFNFDTIEFRPANNTQAPATNLFQEVKVEVSSAPVAPAILADPQDQALSSGQTATFSAVVNGTLPLSYQWYFNDTNTPIGAASSVNFPPAHTPVANPSLTLTNVQLTDVGDYFVVVTNSSGSVTSAVANLTVTEAAPTITTQPQDLTVIPTQPTAFSVVAVGSEPLSYQWYYNTNSLLTNATSSTLTISNVQPSDAGIYSVIVSNPIGTAVSSNAVLTVNTNPVTPIFILQPVGFTARVGDNASFSASTIGAQPISYQWKANGTPIVGATSTTINLPGIQLTDAGTYTLVASNAIGSTSSLNATLTVLPRTPPLPVIPTNTFNILDFGGLGNGVSNNAAAIQSAINTAAGAGGGTVIVPSGGTLSTYLSGPIILSSSINLEVDSGATLKMLPRFATATVTNWPSPSLPPFISASGLNDIEISGSGTIDGNAGFGSTNWWQSPTLDESLRPHMIDFSGCTRVLIQGVTLQNPPVFHMLLKGNNVSVTVQNITENTPGNSPNTDGMDVGSTNVLVQNCSISVGDDNIQMGSSAAPVADMTVSNCTFGTGHGVSIGSPTQRGVHDLLVSNCTFNGTDNGIRLKSDRDIGGLVENLRYIDITMTNVDYPIIVYSFYDSIGTPNNIMPSNAAANAAQPIVDNTPIWRNILFSNLTVTATTGNNIAGILWGRQEMVVSNVTLYNVNFAAPTKTFDIYNARGIRIINSNLTAPSSTNTLTLYNAEVLITNSAPGINVVTLGGLAKGGTNNNLSFFNTQATITDTNMLGTNPLLTLGSSTFTVSNSLNLGGTSTLNFGLGTNATEIVVIGNLSVSGTLNITDAGGFTNNTYTLFTYGGTLTYNGITMGTTPNANFTYTVSTNTIGQVNLVVGSNMPPSDPFTAWENQYFTLAELGTSSFSGPGADPLGKGMSNTNQFLAGLNPTNSASALRITAVTPEGHNVTITWTTAGVRTNAVQASTGDGNGGYGTNFSDISPPIIITVGGDATTNYVDSGGATNSPARYYRIRLVP
ncbi:MAG TPA: glycosyl hydrolase family 28 protein [Verrucomicrobiae bacterium]|nr:glycosyl hydrolase family 28 protein [Verrucomicrobiae bacterium]